MTVTLSIVITVVVRLGEWARREGVAYITAWRCWNEGKLPVPARKAGRLILVDAPEPGQGRTVVCARSVPLIRSRISMARSRGSWRGAETSLCRWIKDRLRCTYTTGALRVEGSRTVVLPGAGAVRTAENIRALWRHTRRGTARIMAATIRGDRNSIPHHGGTQARRQLPHGRITRGQLIPSPAI